MKQLSKLESAIFLLGGVLMVVGAACFAFGFSHPQLVQVTSWGVPAGHHTLQRDAGDAVL